MQATLWLEPGLVRQQQYRRALGNVSVTFTQDVGADGQPLHPGRGGAPGDPFGPVQTSDGCTFVFRLTGAGKPMFSTRLLFPHRGE